MRNSGQTIQRIVTTAAGVLTACWLAGACGSDAAAPPAGPGDLGPGATPDGGLVPPPVGPDSGSSESGLDSGPNDSGTPPDAGDAGDPAPDPATYNDVTDGTKWTAYDLVATANLTQNGLFGATFDGRFLYFGCANGGPTTRYDTQKAFTDAASWSTHTTAPDLAGALFDGRYAYFVPSGAPNAIRFDSQGTFENDSSWESFATTAIGPDVSSFSGGVFDGRYVYYLGNNATGTLARFDTQKSFTDTTAWTSYATSAVATGLTELNGGVFDGRYVYSAAYSSAVVARYDTQAQFDDPSSWSGFATQAADATVTSLYAAGFDGHYVYFAPNSLATTSTLVRYDARMSFDDLAAWSSFDVATVSPGQTLHYVTAFDGRYLYVVPSQGHLLTRYDTRKPFADMASWTSFDLASQTGASTNYGGAVFDGRFLYLEPISSGTNVVVLRFDAKSPAAMPALPQFHGSFY